jgi:hypothetical protein
LATLPGSSAARERGPSLSYVVRVVVDDASTRDAIVTWLAERHVGDVCASGAEHAEIVILDGEPPAVEIRYRFGSREAFARYERDHATARRAEGVAFLASLGLAPGRGVTMTRATGVIVPVAPAPPQAATRAP